MANKGVIVLRELGKVISCVTDSKEKIWFDLWQVSYEFCIKNYDHAKRVNVEWGVEPVFLVLASFLYVEHPLIVFDGRMMYSFVDSVYRIQMAESFKEDLPIIPETVDNPPFPVD